MGINSLNPREEALLFWGLAAFAAMCLSGDIRRSLISLISTLASKPISLTLLAMVTYVCFVVFGAYLVGFWEGFLLKDTILWLGGSAFVLLMGVTTNAGKEGFFKSTLRNSLTLAVVIQFVTNAYTFSFLAELLLLPVIVLLAFAQVAGSTDPRLKGIDRVIQGLLVAIYLGLFLMSLAKAIEEIGIFASWERTKEFLLPVFLTAAYLPFLYFMALYAAYEQVFVRLDIVLKDRRELSILAKRRILRACLHRLRDINRVSHEFSLQLVRIRDESDLDLLIQNLKSATPT